MDNSTLKIFMSDKPATLDDFVAAVGEHTRFLIGGPHIEPGEFDPYDKTPNAPVPVYRSGIALFRLDPNEQTKWILGRLAKLDIPIGDPSVSARHCSFEFKRGIYTIVDTDSTFGTFINKKRLDSRYPQVIFGNPNLKFGQSAIYQFLRK